MFFFDASCGPRRGRGGWEGFGDWGGGPPRGKAHWRGRAARLFEQGDLKYVILRLLEEKPRHGYDIAKLIAQRSDGVLSFHAASLYPLLYRMEARGWIQGRWVEKATQRRRRHYSLTPRGRQELAKRRCGWNVFIAALTRVAGLDHA